MSGGTHSILAPSGGAIWMQCAAAPRMQEPYANDPPTPESMEGDAAHWLACIRATHGASPTYDTAPNGVKIDQDMIDGAELFASVVGPGANHERRVLCELIHLHCFGTPDADRLEPRVLRIFDYKYGHRFVEVFENWQLVAYAVGRLGEIPRTQWPTWVEFVIVQPRAYHSEGPVRKWRCTVDELVTLANQMHAAAAKAVDERGKPLPNAPATTGPECRDCKARHECTLFQSVAAKIVDDTGRTERFNLPPAQLGAELAYLDESLERLKARRDGLAIQAESHICNGRAVQGYEMGEGRASEAWTAAATYDAVNAFASVFGVSLAAKPKLLTPTQARAEIKRRALDPALLDAYAHRPRGAMSLTRSSTIRARKAFGVTSK